MKSGRIPRSRIPQSIAVEFVPPPKDTANQAPDRTWPLGRDEAERVSGRAAMSVILFVRQRRRFAMPTNPIPGTRLVEDVLKALPTQARLESENRELRLQVADLTAKIEVLQAQLKAAQPVEGMEPDALKVLKILFEHNHALVSATFEEALSMKSAVVIYHCDNLCKLGLVRKTASYGAYEIQPAGRTFLIKGGFA
jgi:hypothetical protein